MLVELSSDDPHVQPLHFRVNELPVKIGRSTQADVRVPHPLVSRLHCEFFCQHGTLFLRDLGSTNHTALNGKSISQAEVQSGDEILIGGICFWVNMARAVPETPEHATDDSFAMAE